MMNRVLKLHPYLAILWSAIVIFFIAFTTHSLVIENKIQTDLLALLPTQDNLLLKEAQNFMEDSGIHNRLIILVGHQDQHKAKKAFLQLRNTLKLLPVTIESGQEKAAHYKKLFQNLYSHKYGFLSHDDAKKIESDTSFLTNRALSYIASPVSFGTPNLKEDPFFLFPSFVQQILPNSPFDQDTEGNLTLLNNDTTWYLLTASLKDTAFSLTTQKEILEKLEPYFDSFTKDGIKILKTGALFYAAAGFKQANTEMSTLGAISALGVLILVFLFFKSTQPILMAIAVLISGISVSLSLCLYLFGAVHIVALLFGCSLIGVTVDYVVHYYHAALNLDKSSDRFQVFKALMPAMFLALLSSVFGYAVLGIVPFPGIQQMAILAALGLLAAFISLILWGPYCIKIKYKKPFLFFEKLLFFLITLSEYGTKKIVKKIWTLLCLLFFALSCFNLSFNDDMRAFQSLNVTLKNEEECIKNLIKFDLPEHFILIRGNNMDDILEQEEEFFSKNAPFIQKSISQLIPSSKKQLKNYELIQSLHKKELHHLSKILGINLKSNLDSVVFYPYKLKALDDLPDGFRHLIRQEKDGSFTSRIILIKQVNLHKNERAPYIHPIQEYQNLFQKYRSSAQYMLAFSILIIAVFSILLHGLKGSFQIMRPITLSLLGTIGMINFLNISFTLFHIMGALLVLCIGIDYALFLYCRQSDQENSLLLANVMCAATTILSFGFLAFSQTKAIHDFGLVVLIGIILCFFNTTLFLGKKT
jgi:predicted exporter